MLLLDGGKITVWPCICSLSPQARVTSHESSWTFFPIITSGQDRYIAHCTAFNYIWFEPGQRPIISRYNISIPFFQNGIEARLISCQWLTMDSCWQGAALPTTPSPWGGSAPQQGRASPGTWAARLAGWSLATGFRSLVVTAYYAVTTSGRNGVLRRYD